MSQPLGAIDTFSTACHPSQTVHQLMSPFLGERHKLRRVVLHRCLFQSQRLELNSSHLRYTTQSTSQQQTTVKFHGVFASHWRSLAFAPEWCIQEVPVRDSRDLVTPFMQVVIQTTRHLAHFCYFHSKRATNHFWRTIISELSPYIAVRIGLSLHFIQSLTQLTPRKYLHQVLDVQSLRIHPRHKVEDVFPADCLHLLIFRVRYSVTRIISYNKIQRFSSIWSNFYLVFFGLLNTSLKAT